MYHVQISSEPVSNATIGQQTRRGITWNLVGTIVTTGMRFLVLVVLGRMLTSEDFGIVAAAVSVNTIVYSVRDVGIGPALVQRKQLEPAHLTTAFAVSTYLGVLLAAVLFLAAPWIGETFHIGESTDVIRALAVLFVLRNLAATSRMMCRRRMDFRLLTIVDTSSFAIGSAVSIVAVFVIGGPWSLVIGYWTEEVIATVAYLRYSPPEWSLRIDMLRLRELLGFGVGQTTIQVMTTVAGYGDNIVVGRALGPSALGFYSRAFDLVRFPAMLFVAIVGNVLFAAFSRIQDDRDELARKFRRVLFVNALALLPASAALVIVAPETIHLLMGPGWDTAVFPFQILAVTMVMRPNQTLGAVVANAAGSVNSVAIAFVVYVIVLVGGAALAVRWDIVGVAMSTSIAITILSFSCLYLAMRVTRLGLAEVLGAHAPGLVLAGLVIATTWPLATFLRTLEAPVPVVFGVVAVFSVVLCGVAVLLWMRTGRGDFAWLRSEMPRILRRKSGEAA